MYVRPPVSAVFLSAVFGIRWINIMLYYSVKRITFKEAFLVASVILEPEWYSMIVPKSHCATLMMRPWQYKTW